MKDPAFLFYTKDFQSGTQDMSCEEVGAYLRLLMYQHQHSAIPNDEERMMRITGIFSVEKFNQIMKMVKPKFNQTSNHLVNQRLNQEATDRATSKPKKIASATLAGLISADKKLNQSQMFELKKLFSINEFLELPENEIKEKVREWFNKMVNQMVNNLADANADANVNKDLGKGGTGEKPKRKPRTSISIRETENQFLVMPFDTETFKAQWQLWKVYRSKEHKFNYKTEISEQAALTELSGFANGDEKKAIAVIHQSMAKGWKGFFELKNTTDGKQKNGEAPTGFHSNR